jgi:WD40 repeat protein/DNA-binding MarR family transcriptional regulator
MRTTKTNFIIKNFFETVFNYKIRFRKKNFLNKFKIIMFTDILLFILLFSSFSSSGGSQSIALKSQNEKSSKIFPIKNSRLSDITQARENPKFGDTIYSMNVKSRTVSMDFSPDGRLLATAHENGNLYVWDISNGNLIKTIESSILFISEIKFSPNGKLIAVANESNLDIWSIGNWTLLKDFSGFHSYGRFAFSHNSEFIVKIDGITAFCPSGPPCLELISYALTVLNIFDKTIIKKIDTKIHSNGIYDVVFTENDSIVAILNGETHVIDYFDILTGVKIDDYKINFDFNLKFKDRFYISPQYDQSIIIYNIFSKTKMSKINISYNYEHTTLDISSDGKKLIYLNTSSNELILFDINSGLIIQNRSNIDSLSNYNFGSFSLLFSPEGTTVAIAGYFGLIKLLDLTPNPIIISNSQAFNSSLPLKDSFFSSNTKYSYSNFNLLNPPNQIVIQDLIDPNIVQTFNISLNQCKINSVVLSCWVYFRHVLSPDQKSMVLYTFNSTLLNGQEKPINILAYYFINVQSNTFTQIETFLNSQYSSLDYFYSIDNIPISFSPDNNYFTIFSPDGKIEIRETSTGAKITSIQTKCSSYNEPWWSGDNNNTFTIFQNSNLIISCKNYLEVWNPENGLISNYTDSLLSYSTFDEKYIDYENTMTISDQGQFLVLGQNMIKNQNSSSSLFIFNQIDHVVIHIPIELENSHTERINSMKFIPNSTILIVSVGQIGQNEKLQFWSVTEGIFLSEINFYGCSISPFVISEDGKTIFMVKSSLQRFGRNDFYFKNQILNWNLYQNSVPTFLDFDSDGMFDVWEKKYDLNTEYFWDKFADPDLDGLMNIFEFYLNTNPLNFDTNNNGLSDYEEFLNRSYVLLSPSLDQIIKEYKNIQVTIISTISSSPSEILFISIFLIIFLSFLMLSYYLRTKWDNNQNSISNEVISSETSSIVKIQFLRSIYSKTLIGIEQVQRLLYANMNQSEIQSLITIDLTKSKIVSNLYPEDIQLEMKSQLKGRTMLLLIELAYQGPMKSNSKFISDILNIPHPTVTKDIKKLMDLHYIRQYISSNMLDDTRFKYYTLTEKGFIFLHLLKESLSVTIMHATPKLE